MLAQLVRVGVALGEAGGQGLAGVRDGSTADRHDDVGPDLAALGDQPADRIERDVLRALVGDTGAVLAECLAYALLHARAT